MFRRALRRTSKRRKAVLQTATLNLDWTDIRAPITGRVGRIEITPGNLIAAGPSSPLLTSLVSISPIYASFEADENVVAKRFGRSSRGSQQPRLR